MFGVIPHGYWTPMEAAEWLFIMAQQGRISSNHCIDERSDADFVLREHLTGDRLQAVAVDPAGRMQTLEAKFWRSPFGPPAFENGYCDMPGVPEACFDILLEQKLVQQVFSPAAAESASATHANASKASAADAPATVMNDTERTSRPSVATMNRTGAAGRPTSKYHAVAEMRARRVRGQMQDTLRAEAEALLKFLQQAFPDDRHATVKSLADAIRPEYWKLKTPQRAAEN